MTTILDRFVTVFDFQTNTGRLNRLERRIDKVQRKLDTIARGAGAAGAALTAGAGFAVRGFAQYETELAKIEGLVGISRQQLQAWQEDIEDIGTSTGKSPVELAKGLFFITSAGFKGSEALDILNISAKASAAGLGETETIADLLTSTLGVYKDGSIDAAGAADQLTAAIREGKLEPRTLGRSLATVLPFAESVGVEFGEVAGAMAAMSRQGIPAERSATALRGIFNKLIKPTEMGKKALAEVGLSIDDVRKTVREKGLLEGLRTLATAFDGNSDSLARVFEDSEAILGVLSLTGPAAAENAEIIDRVSAANDDLDNALKPVIKTLGFQWDSAVSRAAFVVKDLGERLAPMASWLLGIGNAALDFYDGLGEGPKTFLATVLSLGPALIGGAIGVKAISFFLGGLTPLLAGGTKAIGLFSGALKVVAGAVAANPLMALILGLIALWFYWDEVTAAMEWAGEKFLELLREWGVPVDAIFAWISDAWDAAIDWIDTPLAWIFNWLADGIEGVFGWVKQAWTGVLDWFDGPGQDQSIWDWLLAGVAEPFAWMLTGWAGALAWISAPARGVFDWLGFSTEGIFAWLEDTWDAALAWIEVPATWIWDWLNEGIAGVFGWLTSAWTGVLNWFKGPGEDQSIWDWLTIGIAGPFAWLFSGWTRALAWISAPLRGIFAWLGLPVENIFGWLTTAWDSVLAWLKTPATWVWDWLNEGVTGVFGWLEASWTGVLAWFKGPGQDESVFDWLERGVTAPFDWVVSAWTGVLAWMSAPLVGVFKWLGLPVDDIFGWARAAWTGVLDWMKGPGADQSVWDWLLQGVTGPFFWLYDAWDAAIDWIMAPLEGVWDWLLDPVEGAFAWVSEAWDKVMKGLTDLIPKGVRRVLGIDDEAAEPADERASGAAIPETLAEGIESGESKMLGATKRALKRLRNLTPFSDAKEGPLSDLTASGRSIVTTIAEGIRLGGPAAAQALEDVLRFDALQRLHAPLPVGPAPAAITELRSETRAEAAAQSVRSEVSLHIEKIEVVVPNGDPREIAATLADELRDQLRRAAEDADSTRIV